MLLLVLPLGVDESIIVGEKNVYEEIFQQSEVLSLEEEREDEMLVA